MVFCQMGSMISTVERGVGKPMLLSGSMVNPLAQFVGQPGTTGPISSS
jgi:hypothetical protein